MSYMRKGFLKYEEMCKYLTIYEEVVSHIWLCNCSIQNFLINEENLIFFFLSQWALPIRGELWTKMEKSGPFYHSNNFATYCYHHLRYLHRVFLNNTNITIVKVNSRLQKYRNQYFIPFFLTFVSNITDNNTLEPISECNVQRNHF